MDNRYQVVLENITVEHRGEIILNKLSLSLKKGHIYGLVSQNGVGKTTLLKVMAGILETTDGSIRYQDDVRIGYSIEDSLLFDDCTVEQNISYYGKLCGSYDNAGVENMLAFTGANEFRGKSVKKISKGMKQRTSIAISLIGKPNLLLWDEAVSGIDILLKKKMGDYLISIVEDKKMCVVTADHDVSMLLDMCSDYIFLKQDASIDQISKDELFGEKTDKETAEEIFMDILENKR